MAVTLTLTSLMAFGLLLTLLLSGGMLRLLWLGIYSLWQERNYTLLVLLTLAAYPILADQTIRMIIGPLLLGGLMIGGAIEALHHVMPYVMDLWPRQNRLIRLALVGVLIDISLTFQAYLMASFR